MTRRFSNAIRSTGRAVRITGNNGESFTASIQPLHAGDSAKTETGTGSPGQYKLYTAWDKITSALRAGIFLECGGTVYLIESVDTMYLSDKPVFRQGILTEVLEGGV